MDVKYKISDPSLTSVLLTVLRGSIRSHRLIGLHWQRNFLSSPLLRLLPGPTIFVHAIGPDENGPSLLDRNDPKFLVLTAILREI